VGGSAALIFISLPATFLCQHHVLGHELAGVVDAVGLGVAESWLGKTCGVQPARFCGQCTACLAAPELCARFDCLGNTRDGGLAEYTLVPAAQLVPWEGGRLSELSGWSHLPACCRLFRWWLCRACILVLGGGVLGES
jgi:threonine dehydrogenase-like Zn-dependent dehydrogenase